MSVRWRLIDTGAQDPVTNMAFDEAILRGYEQHSSPPTLRIYRWEPPGISFGYSQDPKELLDVELCREASVPFIRRITGGGIILHDNELTYSLVCSREALGISARVASSYKIICSFLITFYKTLGIEAEFASDALSGEMLGRPSTLCFAAKEKYDIVANGRKIGGSAQKRSKNVIFQHGSIPLGISKKGASSFLRNKMDNRTSGGAVSLEEIIGREVTAQEGSKILVKSFIKSFGLKLNAGGLSDVEKKVFKDLKACKYESADWNYSRIDHTALEDKGSVNAHFAARMGQ